MDIMNKERAEKFEKLVEQKRDEIEQELKNALRLSYANHNMINVLLFEDGEIRTVEDVSHGRESYESDTDHIMVGRFDEQFTNPISDWYDDEYILLDDYENDFTDEEHKKYNVSVDDEADVDERLGWISKNCPDAVSKRYEYALSEIISEFDFDEMISQCLQTEEG